MVLKEENIEKLKKSLPTPPDLGSRLPEPIGNKEAYTGIGSSLVLIFLMFVIPLQVQAPIPQFSSAYIDAEGVAPNGACIEDPDHEKYKAFTNSDAEAKTTVNGFISSFRFCQYAGDDSFELGEGILDDEPSNKELVSEKMSVGQAVFNDYYKVSVAFP